MKIDDMEQLDALLKLLHRHGVHTCVVDGITLSLVPMGAQEKPAPAEAASEFLDPVTGLPLTDDEILFYSSRLKNGAN